MAQPSVGTETTQNLEVAKGQILESLGEGTAASGGVAHCGELGPGPAKAESTPPPVDALASAAGTVPTSQPAKSWASPAFFMIRSPLPPARLWLLWKLRTPLPP